MLSISNSTEHPRQIANRVEGKINREFAGDIPGLKKHIPEGFLFTTEELERLAKLEYKAGVRKKNRAA